MSTRGIASHRPRRVPPHNRSAASELDLSIAMVNALWLIKTGRDDGSASARKTYNALRRRGLLAPEPTQVIDSGDEPCPLSAEGRDACARLFPGISAPPELADMPDWDSPAQPDHLADLVAEASP